MLNYNKFKTEKILESLINESFLYYTKDFEKILKKIKNNNIAEELLSLKGTDVKPDMTFINVSDKEGYITFSQINKGINVIKKWGEENYLVEPINTIIINNINTGKFKFEYGTTKYGYGFNDDLLSKSRNEVKLGKLVNSVFPGKYSAKEVEEFVNKYKTYSVDEKDFEIVDGEDILFWYDGNKYKEETGSLGQSCMRHSRCESYLGIYSENKDVCKLLILKDIVEKDKIVGRALIWKLEEIYDENKDKIEVEYFIDRIYVTEDKYMTDFKDYSDKNGWCYRTGTGYSDCKDITFKGKSYRRTRMTVKLENWDFEEYPYMDTFKRLNTKESRLYNDDDSVSNCYLMENTDGTYEDSSGVYSEYFDCRIPEGDYIYSEPLGDYIWRDDATEVTIGLRRECGWYPSEYEELRYDEYREETIHSDSAAYCEYEDAYFYDADGVECITEFNGIHDYSHETFSENCGNVVNYYNMACKSYLVENDLEDYVFHQDLLDNDRGKFYFKDFRVEVFMTSKGEYSKTDCEILDIKDNEMVKGKNGKNAESYFTDQFAYNYKLKSDKLIIPLMNKCEEKMANYKEIINSKQPRLDFEDDGEYVEKTKAMYNFVEDRYDEIVSFNI
jgi:hypothetical protein